MPAQSPLSLMSSSYTELRYFRSQNQRVESLHPAPAQDTCLQQGLENPDKAGDLLLLELCRAEDPGAFLCLRCHVSHALELKARDLVAQFRPHTGLELQEIASFALLDDGDRRQRLSYNDLRQQPSDSILPFTAQVICSFDPGRGAGLPHWAKFLLNSYAPLKEYLRDVHGLILISDWALLADSTPSRIRKAWPFLPKDCPLAMEEALALHAAYGQHYKGDRLEHQRRHGRSGGYAPSESMLRAIRPQANPESTPTLTLLLGIAKAIRRYRSPGWEKQLACQSDDASSARDPIESLEDPRSLHESDDSASQLQQIGAALQRALDRLMPAVIAPAANDPLLLCLWRGFTEGLTNRPNAQRCGCSPGQVSKKLRPEQHATTVARQAAHELSRLPDFDSVAASAEGAERMVEALRNQLLAPEQKGEEFLPTLKQWVQRHLPNP
jgi:hypothetical protein